MEQPHYRSWSYSSAIYMHFFCYKAYLLLHPHCLSALVTLMVKETKILVLVRLRDILKKSELLGEKSKNK